MSFDALTLAAVLDELEPLLRDSRVQRLAFPDDLSLAFECFAPGAGRTFVLCSAHQDTGRVQKLTELPARGLEKDTPWSLVARKHLRNARIRSLRQPRLERVLELDCEQRDASGQHYRILLIVEAMGRRSNLVLVAADGVIVDAARRSPPSRNPRRPVLPHLRYEPPPPQDRLLPEQLSQLVLADLARSRAGSLASFLGQTIAGLSPLRASLRSAPVVELKRQSRRRTGQRCWRHWSSSWPRASRRSRSATSSRSRSLPTRWSTSPRLVRSCGAARR